MKFTHVPFTPAGTMLAHLERNTEDAAWEALLREAAHMPYKTKQGFIERGYTVEPTKTPALEIDGRYNWIGQRERLIYIGKHRGWYQFVRVEEPKIVWCEVLRESLDQFEETKP